MENELIIRFAKQKDIDQLIYLFKEHACFEKNEFKLENKKEKLKELLSSTSPVFYCLVVESNSKLIGYASYMKQFSTWDTSFYLYLDCLFLNKDSRGLGIGKKLMKRIKKESLLLGCNLIQWQTPFFNKNAIEFYNKIGAISKNKKRFFLAI